MPYVEIGRHKVLFLHIPKTGGTSIESWLSQYGELRFFSASRLTFSESRPQHYTYSEIESLIGPDYFTYKFAIVRNPYARMRSEYQMRRAIGKERQKVGFPNLSSWLEENIDAARRNKFHLDNHFRPQHEFVENDVQVFRYEDGLERIAKQLMSDLGLEPKTPVPHLMKSEPVRDSGGFTARATRQVNQFFAEDFVVFDHFVRRDAKSPVRHLSQPTGERNRRSAAPHDPPMVARASLRDTYEVSFLHLNEAKSECLMRSVVQAKDKNAAIAAAMRRAKALPGSGINAFKLQKVGANEDGDVHLL